MISAPIVNHYRFLRSVAFANFERLMLCAIWSAADAMRVIVLETKKAGCVVTAPAAHIGAGARLSNA